MNIRLANSEDLARIMVIYNQAIAAGQKTADTVPVTIEERKQWFDEHPSNHYPVLVAEKNGEVVGYLTISAYRPGRMALRHTAEVSFYVDFAYHRQGIGSQLLEHAIEMCPSLEIKNLFAILMETNTASIEKLKKYGFKQWAHLPQVADYDGVEIGQLYFGLRIE